MKIRGKVKTQPIQFSEAFLNDLLNDGNSCVTLKLKKQHLSLHPFHFNNLNAAVKDILNGRIKKFNKEYVKSFACKSEVDYYCKFFFRLDGILLGYRNIKVLECSAPVYDDSCFAHINIEAEFFIFKPEINKILHGTVVKKIRDQYIGCLLHQIFNVSLPRPKEAEDWVGADMHVGHEISFRITYLNMESHIPYIKAQPM